MWLYWWKLMHPTNKPAACSSMFGTGLEDLFQRPVDLLTESSLRNPYLRAEVERTKMLIYDGAKRQVLV